MTACRPGTRQNVSFGQMAETVRQRLNILDVAKWLGMDVRGDRAPCPFHEEHSFGAFQFNVRQGYCHCHSCGEGADIIGLVAHVRSVTSLEALRALNGAYALNLPLSGQAPSQSQRKAQSEWEKRQAIRRLNKVQQARLKVILDELENWAQRFCPLTVDEQLDERYIFALNVREVAEAYLTALESKINPADAHARIKAWQDEMEKLDLQWRRRREITAGIQDMFDDFIAGRTTYKTMAKKHRKAVREWQRN